MGWLGLGDYSDNNREDITYAPPKRGAARFLQLLLRDLWEYVKANILCCLCFFPAALAGAIALVLSKNYLLSSLFALLFSFPAGGGLCGLHRVLNRSARDLESRTGPAFWKGFRDSFRVAIVPGMLTVSELLLCFYLLLFHTAINAFPMPIRLWTLLILLLFFLHILLQYCLPLLTVVDLPLRHLLRNSMILFFAKPKRSLQCFFMTALCLAAGILLFPANLLVVFTIGIALPALIQQLCTWEIIDQHFSITERQQEANRNN